MSDRRTESEDAAAGEETNAEESASDPRFYALRNAAFADREAAQKLIASDPSIVAAKNSIGETALHFLVVEDHLDAVAFLAQQGADVNTCNAFGEPAIAEAAGLGYVEMVELLLELGAKMDGAELMERTDPAKSKQFAAILQAHGVTTRRRRTRRKTRQ